MVILFSSSGVLGWAIWDSIPLISCLLVATISILKLIMPNILSSDKDISKIEKAYNFYLDYHLKLECLYYDHTENRIDESQLLIRFQDIKRSEMPSLNTINEVHKYESEKLRKRAKIIADNFINTSYT
jgi:hypothetical protein